MLIERPRIVVAESSGFSPDAAALLAKLGHLVLADLDRAGLLRAVADADVLWVRLRHAIDTEVLARAGGLKFIVSPTTGLNHIDLPAVQRRGIQLLSLRGETEFLQGVRATAEHTLALLLALLRHIPAAAGHVVGGGWDRDLFRGQELFGKVAGVVGYGRLGRTVARYLRAFEMRVLAADRDGTVVRAEPGIIPVSLVELLRASDVVTLHASHAAPERPMFRRDHFAAMRPGAIFINTARGELVDEAALLESLRSGHLAGAALDVLSDEHATGRPHHPLVVYARTHENLIITPHIGGCTKESMEKTEMFLAGRLAALCRSPRTIRFTNLSSGVTSG